MTGHSLLRAPRHVAIIFARVLHTGMTAMIQSTVILIVALFLGAHPKSALGFLTVLAASALLGSGMGGISQQKAAARALFDPATRP